MSFPRSKRRRTARRQILIAGSLWFGLLFPSWAYARVGNVPQIPAFLPTVDQVSATQAMPLDGTWLVNTIRKKIRIEAGRAYAVDGWTHMFVLNVQPGMVVIQNIMPTKAGEYTGDDLPLAGKWTAKVLPDRSIAVSVAGALGPVAYKLIPVQIDNPQWYAQEMQAAGLAVPNAAPTTPRYQFTAPGGNEPPARADENKPPSAADESDCKTKRYDPKSDTIVCAGS